MYILRDLDEDRVPLKFAISVPKKKLKKAVDRNLIKRRCREAYRLNNSALKDLLTSHNKQLILMFIYLNHEIKEYITIEKSIKKHLNALLSEISA
jgi:ribonuclease P protein component